MERKSPILLPGTDRQPEILIKNITGEFKKILIIGTGASQTGLMLRDHYVADVIMIVEDEDSLLTGRILIKGEKNIAVRLMDFTSTDFRRDEFDLIYAQASISDKRRNKILKEVKRILKPGGIFCAGEIIRSMPDAPVFVTDIWETSGIFPLEKDEVVPFYKKYFELLFEQDLKSTLTEYYSRQSEMLPDAAEGMDDHEKRYYKKLLNRMSHESNVYLKLGGEKFMGYMMMILRKND